MPTLHSPHLVSTTSDPSVREPTSRSTKSKLPTLYLPCTTLAPFYTGADTSFDQDKPAYPRPHPSHTTHGRPSNRSSNRPRLSSLPCTVQHTAAHNRARLEGIEFHQVQPGYPAPPVRRRHLEKSPQPLQVSRNPENPLGKSRRRTAYPQQIVTTRLLYCLQDRFAQLSRLQRI